MNEVHGGRLVVDALKREGVTHIFSLSGGHINPIYKACMAEGITVVDTRHEQAAAHMAEAWGRLSRKPGVCVVTAGPGLTDAMTGIANASQACAPLLVIAGRSGVSEEETLALQEMEQIDLVRPLTKWAKVVYQTHRLDEFTAMAFRHAMTGRPGPVFLEVPVDVLVRKVDEKKAVRPEGYRPLHKPAGSPEAVARALEMLAEAKKPAIIAGSGAHYADAGAELAEFAELTGVPVFTNQMGRGVIPDDHPGCGGKITTGGISTLFMCDLVIVLGARLGFTLLFGKPPVISSAAKVIQVDIEGAEIGRNRKIDLGVVGDVKEVLKAMIAGAKGAKWPRADWGKTMVDKARAAEAAILGSMSDKTDPIHPLHLMKVIGEVIDRDAIVVGDGGDTQAWTNMSRQVVTPGGYLDSGNFGCLGVGLPFALAAKLMHPERQVLVTMGDGSAGFNIMEFDTARRFGLPVVMVVMNDCSWGMIRHIQRATFGPGRSVGCELGSVDYHKVVEALGGHGELVERAEDIKPALERALASGKPSCLNVYVDRSAMSPASMLLAGLGAG